MTDETKNKEKKRNRNLTKKEKVLMEEFVQSDAFKEFIKLIGSNKGVQRYFEITQCLKDEIKKEQYGGLSYDEIIDTGLSKPLDKIDLSALFNGEIDSYIIPNSLLKKALEKIETNIKHTENIELPTDRVNSMVWTDIEELKKKQEEEEKNQEEEEKNQEEEEEEKNQEEEEEKNQEEEEEEEKNQIVIKTGETGEVFYSVNFDDLKNIANGVQITKVLTAFDKLVYIATAALLNAGNEYFSVTQIAKYMGYTSRPGTNTLNQINDSITKMQRTFVKIDNTNEIVAEYNYPKVIYDGALLPVERVSKIINGKFTDAAIHLFREPPLISFAKGRKQITTLPLKILQNPVDKTEPSIKMNDYLVRQIAWMKNGKTRSNKITYTNMCKNLEIENSRKNYNKIKRLKDKASDFIKYYKECKFIKDYEIEPEGIKIYI